MSAKILPFRPDLDRDELIRQARAVYESIFPTTVLVDNPTDSGKSRILRRRAKILFRNLNGPIIDH
jgi:hypothetical protein